MDVVESATFIRPVRITCAVATRDGPGTVFSASISTSASERLHQPVLEMLIRIARTLRDPSNASVLRDFDPITDRPASVFLVSHSQLFDSIQILTNVSRMSSFALGAIPPFVQILKAPTNADVPQDIAVIPRACTPASVSRSTSIDACRR